MTNIILSDGVHKDCDSDDLEDILRSLVDENRICKTCGQDHSLKVKFDGVTITINQIYKLFEEFPESV
jgi:hypothetical protein